jgi:hypothetical protein
MIPSFDYPELAELALPAARAYAKIAPSAPHALHMPSHIFTRLGMWPESIESNLASARVAQEWIARTKTGATAYDALHAMDYLEYAYLQSGQDAKVCAIVDSVEWWELDNPTFRRLCGRGIPATRSSAATGRRRPDHGAARELSLWTRRTRRRSFTLRVRWARPVRRFPAARAWRS